ncbi:hypothetical protein FBU59_003300, partial [Linderina macrospora]
SFLYLNLYKVSQPRYDAGGNLMDAGTDLSQPGLVSYMFDFIYISWATHVLSLVTKWAWGLYMVIPAYAAVVFGPYVRDFLMPQGTGEAASKEDETEQERKRREKKERKKNRVKYVR